MDAQMLTDTVIQYGSFGLVVFVVVFFIVWFVRSGFPKVLETFSKVIERVLSMIAAQEEACRAERVELVKAFREERDFDRKSLRELATLVTTELARLHSIVHEGKERGKGKPTGDSTRE